MNFTFTGNRDNVKISAWFAQAGWFSEFHDCASAEGRELTLRGGRGGERRKKTALHIHYGISCNTELSKRYCVMNGRAVVVVKV